MPAMGRHLWIALIGLVFLTGVNTPVPAQSDLYGFLSGSYVVIGKRPDSNETYSGQINLEKAAVPSNDPFLGRAKEQQPVRVMSPDGKKTVATNAAVVVRLTA